MKNGIELELEKKLIDEIAEEKKFISLSKPALSCTTKCVIWLAR